MVSWQAWWACSCSLFFSTWAEKRCIHSTWTETRSTKAEGCVSPLWRVKCLDGQGKVALKPVEDKSAEDETSSDPPGESGWEPREETALFTLPDVPLASYCSGKGPASTSVCNTRTHTHTHTLGWWLWSLKIPTWFGIPRPGTLTWVTEGWTKLTISWRGRGAALGIYGCFGEDWFGDVDVTPQAAKFARAWRRKTKEGISLCW